mmetsp:Transcript_9620/g.43659  ORF Transcript_9620/g.43659 Transcript_9620/m.43659 type:complete len:86 (-) Transcript_9620:644-901(-)
MTLVSYTSTRPLVHYLLVHDSHMTTQPLPPVARDFFGGGNIPAPPTRAVSLVRFFPRGPSIEPKPKKLVPGPCDCFRCAALATFA